MASELCKLLGRRCPGFVGRSWIGECGYASTAFASYPFGEFLILSVLFPFALCQAIFIGSPLLAKLEDSGTLKAFWDSTDEEAKRIRYRTIAEDCWCFFVDDRHDLLGQSAVAS